MPLAKYKKYYQEMLDFHGELFQKLKEYKPATTEFKETQRKALRIIHEYENALCNQSESTRYGQFSSTLADKFWTEIRREYPEIDLS